MDEVDEGRSPIVSGDSQADAQGTEAAKPMGPQACRKYIRTEAGNRWKNIVGNLLNKAEQASVPHITLVVKLAGFEQGPMAPRGPKRRTKSLAQELREEMEALEARNIAEFGE